MQRSPSQKMNDFPQGWPLLVATKNIQRNIKGERVVLSPGGPAFPFSLKLRPTLPNVNFGKPASKDEKYLARKEKIF